MGKLEVFQIVFDHPQGVHFAGQRLRASVHVTLGEPMKMRGITVHLLGRAKVHWQTGGKHKTHYRAEEVYFNEIVALFGAGGESTTLHAGEHKFPFEMALSASLPSSFEGEYGYIRYVAKATIDKPWKFNHDCKEAFTVLGCLDLAREPLEYKMPIVVEEEKKVTCCCCSMGKITVKLTLNTRCLVPGEPLLINAEITNNSSSTIKRTRCAMKQYREFKGIMQSFFGSNALVPRTTRQYVLNMKGNKIKPGKVDVWTDIPLVIPPVPPSRIDGCGIIDVHYFLKFNVDASNGDMKIQLPIIIGTVPLQRTFASAPPPIDTAEPTAPLMQGFGDSSAQPVSSDPNFGLPTYEECVLGKVQIRDEDDSQYTRGSTTWAPRYPTFQFSNSSTTSTFPLEVADPPNDM